LKQKSKSVLIVTAILAAAAVNEVSAASVNAVVRDERNNFVKEAVVIATPAAGLSTSEQELDMKIIDQVDKEFRPVVSVFQAGTSVEFPNHDDIRHHVYSFSEAKTFEIPLYKGTPAQPIVFDQAGEVTLGCNIHDWMSAYVLVTDTPYFAKTDGDGRVDLAGLPPGEYTVEVWHYEQAAPSEQSAVTVNLTQNETPALEFKIERKKKWVPFRAPTQSQDSY